MAAKKEKQAAAAAARKKAVTPTRGASQVKSPPKVPRQRPASSTPSQLRSTPSKRGSKAEKKAPNLNVRKEGILCTLNINLQTEGSLLWLKRKLKSFLMNNITFYFKATTNTKEHASITLNKLYQQAAEKRQKGFRLESH